MTHSASQLSGKEKSRGKYMSWNWYISVESIRQWMRATSRTGPLEASNPDYVAVESELGELSLTARLGPQSRALGNATVYRGSVISRGMSIAVECSVTPANPPSRPLPQLVHIQRRTKGRKK